MSIIIFYFQAHSQTKWITMYKIFPDNGSQLDYTLNIIDTPGFGDERGPKRDEAIQKRFQHLFSAPGEQGVSYVNAICFVVKAPDARLTHEQKYIFTLIMSLFGEDVRSNICTLITFADGAEPPVLALLKDTKLPYGPTFTFNNYALYETNDHEATQMFWDMGYSNFKRFFKYIEDLKEKKLIETDTVCKKNG